VTHLESAIQTPVTIHSQNHIIISIPSIYYQHHSVSLHTSMYHYTLYIYYIHCRHHCSCQNIKKFVDISRVCSCPSKVFSSRVFLCQEISSQAIQKVFLCTAHSQETRSLLMLKSLSTINHVIHT